MCLEEHAVLSWLRRTAITTYLMICNRAAIREENEAKVVDEMCETDPLLRSVVVTASSGVAERSPPNLVAVTRTTD